MKAVDNFFFTKRLLVPSERHPWIDNEVKNAAAKKFLISKTTYARNKFISQNKIVKNLIIRKQNEVTIKIN